MSQSLSNHTPTRTYLNEVPANTFQEAITAFVISFVIMGALSGGNVGLAVISATLSATATIIHGLVSPMFKQMLNGRTTLRVHEEMVRTGVAIFSAGILASCAGVHHVLTNAFNSLFIATVFNIFSNMIFGPTHRHNVDRANPIFV